jgi:hypothetical protein
VQAVAVAVEQMQEQLRVMAETEFRAVGVERLLPQLLQLVRQVMVEMV